MPKLNSIQFQKCFNSLKKHLADDSYEIHFGKIHGSDVIKLKKQPNWLFRFVRWLVGKYYHDIPAVEKVLLFLKENLEFIQASSSPSEDTLTNHNVINDREFKPIKKGLIARVKNTAEAQKIIKLIDELDKEINKPIINQLDDNTEERDYHLGIIKKEIGVFDDLRQLNGEGTRIFDNGDIEDGTFIEGVFTKGTMTFADDEIKMEIGAFDDQGELIGQGKRIFSDGEEVEGKFDQGYLKEGTMTFKQGHIEQEEGTFDEDEELHGKGKRIFFNGDVEIGTYEHGYFSEGTVALKNNMDIQEETGTFNETPELHGSNGQRIFLNGIKQEGHFQDGVFMNGKTTFPNFIEEGPVDGDGELHGRAERIFIDGSKQMGEFEHGVFKYGNILYPKGPIIEEHGNFDENGQLHGKGGIRMYNENELPTGQIYLSEMGEFFHGVYNDTPSIDPQSLQLQNNFLKGSQMQDPDI